MEYLILFVMLTIVVLWGISIYLVRTERLNAREWSLRSLGLPQGSVRALLAFVILFLLSYCILTDIKLPELPEWLIGVLGMIIGFYFGAAMVPTRTSSPSGEDKDIKQ